MEKLAVEFGIYKNKKGKYLVYNMCLPGGGSMARENIEGRTSLGDAMFTGEVVYWTWGGWGHIKPTPGQALPIKVRQEMAKTLAETKKKLAEKPKPNAPPEEVLYFRKQDLGKGFHQPKKEMKVKFKL